MHVPVRFHIDAQSLAGALMALGRQADVQVLAASRVVEQRTSIGARGSLTVADALVRLLEGTGLDYEIVGTRTVVVRPRAFTPAVSYESSLGGTKPSVPIVGSLEAVNVSGVTQGDVGFKAESSRGATRTDMDLSTIPQAVSVLTRDLMDSKQAFDVSDVVRHVAGVNYVDGFGGPPIFRVRGFTTGNGLTDGMPNGVARIEDLPPLVGVERVEVLKGPEAILGEASVDNNFGGTVNIVMKRPQAEPVRQVVASTGRYEGSRLGFDFAGPLDAQGRLTYRWIVAGKYADRTPQGYRGQRGSFMAPSIAWQDDRTHLLLGAEYVNNRVPVPDHTMRFGDMLEQSSPFHVLLGNPDDHAMFRTRRGFYMAEQELAEGWSLRSRGQYVSQRNSGQAWAFLNADRNGDVDVLARSYGYSDAFYTLQNELTARFEQGPLVHDVLLGFDYARTHVGGDGGFVRAAALAPFRFNLLTGARLPAVQTQELATSLARPVGGAWTTHTGVFLQDHLQVGESWDVLATLRRTGYELTGGNHDPSVPQTRRSIWIPRLGVVYKPTANVSVYASTAKGFQADALLGEDGRLLPPASSRQVELGAKLDLFDRRARLTAAVYTIRLDHSVNRISPDPPYFAVPGPGQTNRGVEIEFEGQPWPGLDMSASYADARIRNHDGSRPTNAPRHQLSAWASYRFQRPAWQSWGVAGGVFARSRSVGRAEPGGFFAIPGQASVEANVSYYGYRWWATLGVRNLFSRTLYAVNADASFVPLREGRLVLLSVTREF